MLHITACRTVSPQWQHWPKNLWALNYIVHMCHNYELTTLDGLCRYWAHSMGPQWSPLSRAVVVVVVVVVVVDHRCAGAVRQWRRVIATPGKWQCGVRQLAVANGPNIFQMLLAFCKLSLELSHHASHKIDDIMLHAGRNHHGSTLCFKMRAVFLITNCRRSLQLTAQSMQMF